MHLDNGAVASPVDDGPRLEGLELWESKLHSILREMELCKAGLSACRLNPTQTNAVSKLLKVLEAQVEQLDQTIAGALQNAEHQANPTASFANVRLDDLGELCSRLMLAIFCAPGRINLHA